MWRGERPEIGRGSSYKHTHHDATVETPLINSGDDVLAVTVKNLGARNHETIGVNVESVSVGTLALGPFPELEAFVIADLPNGIGLSSGARFVTLDVVAGNEDTVAGDDLARLEEGDIADEQLIDVDGVLDTRADDFDTTLLLVIEDAGLPSLVPIIEGANRHLWEEG